MGQCMKQVMVGVLFGVSVLFTGCAATSHDGNTSAAYVIDAQATAASPWDAGEVVLQGDMPLLLGPLTRPARYSHVPAYRVFLGVTSSGAYVVQDYYKEGDLKASDPYMLLNRDDVLVSFTDENQQSSMQGAMVTWYPNGHKESEAYFENGDFRGTSFRYYDNGNPMLEMNHDARGRATGPMRLWRYDGSLVGVQMR